MAKQSRASEHLWLLDGLSDFKQHSLQLVGASRRQLAILTRDLDAPLYNTTEFVQAVSTLARSSRYSQVQILVKDTQPALAQSHQLIRLAQRLSQKIQIKKMSFAPENSDMGFMLCDSDKVLYKNDDGAYKGFANYQALREVKQLREQFNYCWQYGKEEPEFKRLSL